MAADKEAIANRALQKLGARGIVDITDPEPNAVSMNTAYTPVLNRLLRQYNWNFAIKRASITADGTQSVFGALNRFALPADFVRLLRQRETSEGCRDSRYDWQIEGGFIVTSEADPLEIRYIAAVEETLFDPVFDELFATVLAKETCKEITGSLGLEGKLDQDIRVTILDARMMNAFETDPVEPVEDTWITGSL